MSDTLLIVDDDPAIITGLQALLEGEWEVRTAMNGRDARAAFAAFSPDVALLDVNLPDVSGLELLHDLKMYSEAVAVIMMSGQGTFDRVVESVLLGHERGAFTNAMNTKPGLFEVAADGTLFLDEIGEMDVTVQARLLKAIEEKRFRRVGGIRDLTANFRLVAATNRDLAQEAAAGRFRSDLYYRLNVVRVRMPPLRERPEDIPVLVEVMLRPLAKEIGKPLPTVSPRALKKLEQYGWPGNVRELRNVLERALLTMHGKENRSESLLLEAHTQAAATSSSALPSAEWEIRPLDAVVADYVTAAVDAAGGNIRKAARQLKISPSTLYARLKGKEGQA